MLFASFRFNTYLKNIKDSRGKKQSFGEVKVVKSSYNNCLWMYILNQNEISHQLSVHLLLISTESLKPWLSFATILTSKQ